MLDWFFNLFKTREIPDEEKRMENGRLVLDVIRGNPELIMMCSSAGAISAETTKRLMKEVEDKVPSTRQKLIEALKEMNAVICEYKEEERRKHHDWE